MKKKLNSELTFYSCVLCGYIAFSVLILNAYFLKTANQAMSKSGQYFPNIIIDPGHGGVDSGAVGIDNVLEKDINLSIALKLRDLLEAGGFNTTMTREIDESIHNKNAKSIRAKKVSDMKNRLSLVNAGANNLLISIHQNKFEESQYNGAQVFFSKNNTRSQELAQSIRTAIKGLLQKDNLREVKPSPKGVFLLNKATVPAVIVECGFLSNNRDVKMLLDEDYQEQMAFSIYCGLLDFWRKA